MHETDNAEVFRETALRLRVTIGALVEQLRQEAYDEGYEDAQGLSGSAAGCHRPRCFLA